MASIPTLVQDFNEATASISPGEPLGEAKRQRLLGLAQDMVFALQTPPEIVLREMFSINMHAPVRICLDLGIFKLLATTKGPLTARSIAASTSAEETLTMRLLRAVSALRLVSEVDTSTYAANKATHALASPLLEAGYGIFYDRATGPQSNLGSFPAFFKENGYRSPTSARDGIYQLAYDCKGTTAFEHWFANPEIAAKFDTWMSGITAYRSTCIDWIEDGVFPPLFSEGSQSSSAPDRTEVAFVDVAGGRGSESLKILKRFPNLQGRVVLQDLPSVLSSIPAKGEIGALDPRIERSEYDMFLPQPVKGAGVYYLHQILHDWPDEEAVVILQRIRDAMSISGADRDAGDAEDGEDRGSRIWIGDQIVPAKGAPFMAAAADILMLAAHSGMERSESQWHALVDRVEGLHITRFLSKEGEIDGLVEIMRTK